MKLPIGNGKSTRMRCSLTSVFDVIRGYSAFVRAANNIIRIFHAHNNGRAMSEHSALSILPQVLYEHYDMMHVTKKWYLLPHLSPVDRDYQTTNNRNYQWKLLLWIERISFGHVYTHGREASLLLLHIVVVVFWPNRTGKSERRKYDRDGKTFK